MKGGRRWEMRGGRQEEVRNGGIGGDRLKVGGGEEDGWRGGEGVTSWKCGENWVAFCTLCEGMT